MERDLKKLKSSGVQIAMHQNPIPFCGNQHCKRTADRIAEIFM